MDQTPTGLPPEPPLPPSLAKEQRETEEIGRFTIRARARKPRLRTLTDEFIEEVKSSLPPQPWKRHVHISVANKLGANHKDVSAAIEILIQRGVWRQQIDGTVYDEAGKVIAADLNRVAQIPPPVERGWNGFHLAVQRRRHSRTTIEKSTAIPRGALLFNGGR